MKQTTTLLLLLFLNGLHAQQNQAKVIQKNVVLINNEPVQPISGISTTIPTKDTNAIVTKIAAIESHIKAIDLKVAYVNSDQEQRERAEKMGWFEQMSRIKSELIEEKTSLSHQLNQKK